MMLAACLYALVAGVFLLNSLAERANNRELDRMGTVDVISIVLLSVFWPATFLTVLVAPDVVSEIEGAAACSDESH